MSIGQISGPPPPPKKKKNVLLSPGVCVAMLLAQAALKSLYALRHRYTDGEVQADDVFYHSHQVLEVEVENQS